MCIKCVLLSLLEEGKEAEVTAQPAQNLEDSATGGNVNSEASIEQFDLAAEEAHLNQMKAVTLEKLAGTVSLLLNHGLMDAADRVLNLLEQIAPAKPEPEPAPAQPEQEEAPVHPQANELPTEVQEVIAQLRAMGLQVEGITVLPVASPR